MTLVLSETRFNPPRFSGAPADTTCDDVLFASEIERRTKPTAEDLSNELDAEVCTALLELIDSGREVSAGRALRVLRDAAHRRFVARAWGDEPEAKDYPMAALKFARLA